MNRMDEGEIFYVTREDFAHLCDIKLPVVRRMGSIEGENGVTATLESLNRGQQHAAIARFIQHELVAEREKATLLHQQGSQQAEHLNKSVLNRQSS